VFEGVYLARAFESSWVSNYSSLHTKWNR